MILLRIGRQVPTKQTNSTSQISDQFCRIFISYKHCNLPWRSTRCSTQVDRQKRACLVTLTSQVVLYNPQEPSYLYGKPHPRRKKVTEEKGWQKQETRGWWFVRSSHLTISVHGYAFPASRTKGTTFILLRKPYFSISHQRFTASIPIFVVHL
ncbi:uncharacterized protein LOC129311604 isoform X2 [Prosopis cineraria]|nr:uncharacterized protein LOC129311604 isoform X2 [Prosopis cineraria]